MERRRNLLVPASFLVTLLAFASNAAAQLPRPPLPSPSKPPPVQRRTPQVGEIAPDFTLPDKSGITVNLVELLVPPAAAQNEQAGNDRWVLLVFYRGYWCPFCNSDLRSLQEHLEGFTARGVRIVAISTDPPDVIRKHVDKQGYSFLFLSDTQTEVIRRYALLRKGEGTRGADVARPAQFLIDSTGIVRWRNLNDDMRVRARPENILKVIDELSVAPSSAPQ
ncbi:MAG: peroxiredoxin family protein [Terriglobia bacterium]